jgi:hypothetical protein
MSGKAYTAKQKALREDAWNEYKIVRDALAKYDDHLFRIRAWHIALVTLLVGAAIGLGQDGKSAKPISASAILAAGTLASLGFWTLDCLNKSLQMVHIYNSRDIERFLRDEGSLYFGPTVSMKFQYKSGYHVVPIVKNYLEESVFPFYLVPLGFLWGTVILVHWPSDTCFYTGISSCELSASRLVVHLALLMCCVLIFLSLAWRHENPRLKYLWRKNAKARRDVIDKLAASGKYIESHGFCIGPFRPKFVGKDGSYAVFVDRKHVQCDAVFQSERRALLSRHGWTAIVEQVSY